MGQIELLSTLFLSLLFRNLTFASIAAFQTHKKCQNVPKICMPITRKWRAPVFAGAGVHLEVTHVRPLPRRGESTEVRSTDRLSLSPLWCTGFHTAGKANPVFPREKNCYLFHRTRTVFLLGNHLFTSYFVSFDQRDIDNSPFLMNRFLHIFITGLILNQVFQSHQNCC